MITHSTSNDMGKPYHIANLSNILRTHVIMPGNTRDTPTILYEHNTNNTKDNTFTSYGEILRW